MNNNRPLLVVAVVAGILATVLAFSYIQSAKGGLEEKDDEPVVEVLFTRADLNAGHPIAAQDLRVEQVSTVTSPGLVRGAVKKSEQDAVLGLRVSIPMPAGVPLLYSNLVQVKDLELNQGTRAMTISVSEDNMMGGILVPEDRVDIIVSYLRPDESATPPLDMENPEASLASLWGQMIPQSSSVPSQWQTEEVLSEVRVIAVGESLSGSRQAQLFGLSGVGGGASTVTLEVTKEEARTLIQAMAGGANPLTLLLCPPKIRAEGE